MNSRELRRKEIDKLKCTESKERSKWSKLDLNRRLPRLNMKRKWNSKD